MSSAHARTESAVLIPTYEAPGGRSLIVVLVRRASGGVHGDQLAFPGGTREPYDRSPLETALREAEEEIGLSRASVGKIEPLPVVDTFTTRYRIHPFLARVRRPAAWAPEAREVAEVIEVAAAELADPRARGTMRVETPAYPGGRTFAYIRVGPHRLWGATYRILEPLLPRLVESDAEGA